MSSARNELLRIYDKLHKRFGPRRWWPADNQFEIIVGAILTQNTAWANVEKAIRNLKDKNLLAPRKLYRINIKTLGGLIRPAGYYNVKTKRLKAFLEFLFKNYNGSLKKMFSGRPQDLRNGLLSVNGIGPETADSILLYAGGMPAFVVDAYTKRVFSRHRFIPASAGYEDVQRFFTDNLPKSPRLFNEFHALIVELGKNTCKPKPRCKICPLRKMKAAYSAR